MKNVEGVCLLNYLWYIFTVDGHVENSGGTLEVSTTDVEEASGEDAVSLAAHDNSTLRVLQVMQTLDVVDFDSMLEIDEYKYKHVQSIAKAL